MIVVQQWGASQTQASTAPVCPHSRSALEETVEWTATSTSWAICRPLPSLCAVASLTTRRSLKVSHSRQPQHRCHTLWCQLWQQEGNWTHLKCVCMFACVYREVPGEDHLVPAVRREPLHHRRPQLSCENWLQVRHSNLLEWENVCVVFILHCMLCGLNCSKCIECMQDSARF